MQTEQEQDWKEHHQYVTIIGSTYFPEKKQIQIGFTTYYGFSLYLWKQCESIEDAKRHKDSWLFPHRWEVYYNNETKEIIRLNKLGYICTIQ